MMQAKRRLILLNSLIVCTALLTGSAWASDKASASAGGGNIARLEPFVVNLASFDHYLQAIITLQVSSAEIGDKVKMFMPVVRHAVIMSLSGKEAIEVQDNAGKKLLIEELRERINKAISAKNDDGVLDIFFENFVIQ
ncbi:flagellar basal body-associated FliL family protein [Undibacterium fentianense]|uniref:Flagellar protein FliL n=1 Tax=Undibacterium fentianense TaxID=2828728 RepID=A0A941E6M7_9BURK|nr:flagellar basal body-associated FliL family protein [Undibacterium fentianense]MBR7801524.1 flagellar basal body-associated FliL family protein [Undibacterium fentianense]